MGGSVLLGEEQPQCVGFDAPLPVDTSFWNVTIFHRLDINITMFII